MMPTLIDSSLWIDFTRTRSPKALKQFILPYILAPHAAVSEPIVFEVMRHATDREIPPLEAQFNTLPLLAAPVDLWKRAATLGQACRNAGVTAGSLDLLIATVAIHHDAELVTFDEDFQPIAQVCKLRLKLLCRPERGN